MRNIAPGNVNDFTPLVAPTDTGAYCRQLPGIGGLNLRAFAFGRGDNMTRTIIVSIDDQGSPSMFADQRGDLRPPFNMPPGAKPLGPRTAITINFAQDFAILENRSDKGEEAMRVGVTDVIDNEKFGNPRKWIAQVLKDCL